jgi:hypothetical protein
MYCFLREVLVLHVEGIDDPVIFVEDRDLDRRIVEEVYPSVVLLLHVHSLAGEVVYHHIDHDVDEGEEVHYDPNFLDHLGELILIEEEARSC